ncbi:MAG: beta-galactosidase small subunit family protein, partial [bacterium]
KTLKDFAIYWEIESEGKIIQQGTLMSPDVQARQSRIYTLGVEPFKPEPGREHFLNLTAFQMKGDDLINSGHIFAYDQFAIPVPSKEMKTTDEGSKVVYQTSDELKVEAGGITFSFDKKSGFLSSVMKAEKEFLASPLTINFWRAPVENDWGNNMPERLGVWKNAGSNAELRSINHEQREEGYYEVDVDYWLADVQSFYFINYEINGNGEIRVNTYMEPMEQGFPELPRFGMTMTVKAEYDQLEWFGRGPHENYIDRNSGAIVGHYSSTVEDQYVPYIAPGENAYKTDTRWLTLTDKRGEGIMLKGMPHIGFSALHFTNEDLSRKKRDEMHTIDLEPREDVFINVDYGQMGVGGDNSWGAKSLAKYSLPFRDYGYSFVIKLIEGGTDFWKAYEEDF